MHTCECLNIQCVCARVYTHISHSVYRPTRTRVRLSIYFSVTHTHTHTHTHTKHTHRTHTQNTHTNTHTHTYDVLTHHALPRHQPSFCVHLPKNNRRHPGHAHQKRNQRARLHLSCAPARASCPRPFSWAAAYCRRSLAVRQAARNRCWPSSQKGHPLPADRMHRPVCSVYVTADVGR